MVLDHMKPMMEKDIFPCKRLVKKGTLDLDVVESSPVVWQGRLLRFEWIRPNGSGGGRGYYGADTESGYFRFVDMETDQVVSSEFAQGKCYGCAYEENGVMYAFGSTWGEDYDHNNTIDVFWSKDLMHWESKEIIRIPEGIVIANSSVCKGRDGYNMIFEIFFPHQKEGLPWSVMYAKSPNLMDWTVLSEPIPQDYPVGCPVMRYCPKDDHYYIISLEHLPYFRHVPYIMRTKDFEQFEMGLVNPVMFPDDHDKKIYYPDKFTPEEVKYIQGTPHNNVSDLDLCDFDGKTVILYSWGTQIGREFLAMAEYDGTVEEFMRSFFAD